VSRGRDHDCARTDDGAVGRGVADCSLESGGGSFGGDSLSGFDESGRRSELERAGRVVDVPSDTSGGVAELRTAAEDDLLPRDSPGDDDQRSPSGVGTTAECRGPPAITGAGSHHLRVEPDRLQLLQRLHPTRRAGGE
jgi:hypothetical protein